MAKDTYDFFPPANKAECSAHAPLLTWLGDGSSVQCMDGQTLLRTTIECKDGQSVVRSGADFVCRSTPQLPTCDSNEVLTFDGSAYACVHSDVPTCTTDQVLSFNGASFVCVTKTDNIPTCSAGQFLTYNGVSFQCAATQKLTLPTCGADEVVTSDGTALRCAPKSSSAATGSWCGLAYSHDCSSFADIVSCNGISMSAGCPAGYSAQTINTSIWYNGDSWEPWCIRTCTKY